MKQDRTYSLFFVIGFLFIIFTIPIWQAVVDYKKDRAIRALGIVVDATVTPFKRALRLHSLGLKVSEYRDTLKAEIETVGPEHFNQERISRIVDDDLQIINDMRNRARTINRHVVLDSTDHEFFIFDSLLKCLEAIQKNADAGQEAFFSGKEPIVRMNQIVSELVHRYPRPNIFDAPALCVKTSQYIFWNDRYIRPFEKELDDNSIFASIVRPLMLHVRYVAFGDLGDKGIPGRKNWMFYTPDVEYLIKPSILDKRSIPLDHNNKPLFIGPIEAICRFQRQLANRGVGLLVVIVPGKPSIYPDLLSKRINPKGPPASIHSLEMIKELRRKGVEAVDLFSAFADERNRDSIAGDSMYLRTDTHWKGRGARLAALVVAQRIKQYPWYTPGTAEYGLDSVVIDRTGDIAVMCGLSLTGKLNSPAPFPPEQTRCYQVYRVLRDSIGNETQRVLYKDDFRSSSILVLGDSFSRIYQTDDPRGAGWIAHLALELSQPVASIVNDGGASTLVRESLKRRQNLLKGKKLVVWEIVERDFRFGAEGWKNVAMEGDCQ
jgi:hypothetical protein